MGVAGRRNGGGEVDVGGDGVMGQQAGENTMNALTLRALLGRASEEAE